MRLPPNFTFWLAASSVNPLEADDTLSDVFTSNVALGDSVLIQTCNHIFVPNPNSRHTRIKFFISSNCLESQRYSKGSIVNCSK